MTRRYRLIALVAAGATLISSCGSAQRSDLVAQVDDQELDQPDLDQIMLSGPESDPQVTGISLPPPNASGEYAITATRPVVERWIWNQLTRAELADRGIEVPAPTFPADNTVNALVNDMRNGFNALLTTEVGREWTEDEVAASFESLRCFNVATAETEEVANDLIDSLNDGGDFYTVTEEGGATSGFGFGCFDPTAATTRLNAQLLQADVEVSDNEIRGLEPGEAIGTWPSTFGFIIMQRSTLSDLDDANLQSLKEESIVIDMLANHDVDVNPVYGSFSTVGLRPLGGTPDNATSE